MFEVVVEGLKYLQGIPVEMTDEAVLAGDLRVGCIVGLSVSPVGDESNKMLIEVRLSEDGQDELIKPGLTLPLDGQGSVYHIRPDWRRYLPRPISDKDREISYNPTRRANSGLF